MSGPSMGGILLLWDFNPRLANFQSLKSKCHNFLKEWSMYGIIRSSSRKTSFPPFCLGFWWAPVQSIHTIHEVEIFLYATGWVCPLRQVNLNMSSYSHLIWNRNTLHTIPYLCIYPASAASAEAADGDVRGGCGYVHSGNSWYGIFMEYRAPTYFITLYRGQQFTVV